MSFNVLLSAGVFIALAMLLAGRVAVASEPSWTAPAIEPPPETSRPVLACTPDELGRLRAAWQGKGAAHAVVAARVARADKALGRPLTFPPRGGQHNQWYQCDACQLALQTLSPTRHRCPRCQKVYTGAPYDDVIFSKVHARNLAGALDAAWAYAITGQSDYAEHAAAVLRGYARRYEAYPYHDSRCRVGSRASKSGGRLFEQTLNEASSLSRTIAPAYDLIAGWDGLGDADRQTIRTGLLLPMLNNVDKHRAGKSNWQTWHNAGMLAGGIVLGDAGWMRQAITGRGNGFVDQMNVSVTTEGMWYENSWGYHFYTLSALVEIVEAARRAGIDLWSHPRLKAMFTLPMAYRMADGTLPRFGDDTGTRLRGDERMEAAWHAYRDPAIAAVLSASPTWDTVMYGRKPARAAADAALGSAVFRGAGHAILRTDGPAGMSAAMTFSSYGGFHGHLDKLSFVFFAYGEELGVDPGRAKSQAYRLPIHRDWYKATIGHNTVLVDGKPQAPAAGELLLFASTPGYAAAAARCTEAYPGVEHTRLLAMTPEYLLVLDRLAADKPHYFDWVYHNRGSDLAGDLALEPAEVAKRGPGYEYLRRARAASTDAAVHLRFVGEKVTTHLLADARKATEVVTADGPFGSVVERVPLTILRRRGRETVFAVVLEPAPKGRRSSVSNVTVQQDADQIVVTVSRGKLSDTLTYELRIKLQVNVDGKAVLSR